MSLSVTEFAWSLSRIQAAASLVARMMSCSVLGKKSKSATVTARAGREGAFQCESHEVVSRQRIFRVDFRNHSAHADAVYRSTGLVAACFLSVMVISLRLGLVLHI